MTNENRCIGEEVITNTPRPGDIPGSRDRDTINALLAVRGKTHGDFSHHASYTQQLKYVMVTAINWETLNSTQKEALEMIAHKIGRILAGNPHYKDHWDDIAGYAKLVADRCEP